MAGYIDLQSYRKSAINVSVISPGLSIEFAANTMDVNDNTDFVKANVEFLANTEKLGKRHHEEKRRVLFFVVLFLVLVAIVILIAGIILIGSSRANKEPLACSKPLAAQTCEYSDEAKSLRFLNFLHDVQEAYYEVFPWEIPLKPGVMDTAVLKVKQRFKPYDFSEAQTRKISDKARYLLDKLKNMRLNADLLNPRERKALAQVKHYLKHSFGSTWFRTNYYTGNWLLGPDIFCWDRICRVGDLLSSSLMYFKPRNVDDLELLKEKLLLVKKGFGDYMRNLQYGIKAGMVRPVEACQRGLQAITSKYTKIANKGEKGK